MANQPPKPKRERSLEEEDALLVAQEAKLEVRKAAQRARKLEYATARVRRLGEALLEAAEEEAKSAATPFLPYTELIAKSDAAAEKDSQQRKEGTKKKGNSTKEATQKAKEGETGS